MPREHHAVCVRCGFCCRQAPCPWGTWDREAQRCAFLQDCPDGSTFCGKYEEILNSPPEARADLAPAFGAGCCCSLFNQYRERLLEREGG